MPIKPWLSRNFLNQMRWSNVRDYPPKRKKPWLSGNFMEMEEVNVEHLDLFPPGSPMGNGDLPLPPPAEIPQDPEDILEPEAEPDPCLGNRNLWVEVSPDTTLDCDEDTGFTLIFSPDFECIAIQQLSIGDGPKIVDDGGNDFSTATNIEDIVGGLSLEAGCEDADSITVAATDCLCGGVATADISLENCGADCTDLYISGPTTVGPNGTTQYTLENAQGNVVWAMANLVYGGGVSIDPASGVLTQNGACGWFAIKATDECCGVRSLNIQSTFGVWQPQGELCNTGHSAFTCWQSTGAYSKRYYVYECVPGAGPGVCSSYSPAPCATACGGESPYAATQYAEDYRWDCPP